MDKQIEEMGVDISIAWQKANQRRSTMCVTRPPLCDVLAEELAKMSYRKIPENAVVLTREEYERLGLVEEIVQEYESVNGQPVLVKERKKVKKIPTDIAEFIRKETAEKFARLVEFHSVSTRDEEGREIFTISASGLKEILHEEFGISYDEICKEITERWNDENTDTI